MNATQILVTVYSPEDSTRVMRREVRLITPSMHDAGTFGGLEERIDHWLFYSYLGCYVRWEFLHPCSSADELLKSIGGTFLA